MGIHTRDDSSCCCSFTKSFWLTLLVLPVVVLLLEVYHGTVLVRESATLQLLRSSRNRTNLQHQTLELVKTANCFSNDSLKIQSPSRSVSQPNSTDQSILSATPSADKQQHPNDITTQQKVIGIFGANHVNESQATFNLSEQKPQATTNGTNNETTVAPSFDDESQHHVQQHQRLNATQILQLLETNRLDRSQVPLIFPKPPIDSYDISSIYSKRAWLKLRTMFLTNTKGNDNNNLVMCVQGASSSAGAVGVPLEDRYHHLFASHNAAVRNVTHVDRAHGARNGMYSVHLMHSFLPMHTDIVLWEFAITDATYHQFDNQTIKMIEARNQLILWLDQLARVSKQRQKEPPLVILVYLWNPNQFTDFILRPDLAYEANKGVAEQYDFVVGHVNAGKYFASMWEPNVTRTYFLADPTHPNNLTNQVVYYLLNDLLMDTTRPERPRTNLSSTNLTTTATINPVTYQWACGDDTPEKRLLRGLLENSHVIASFTQEEPKNKELLPGMMMPMVGGDLKIENLGKSNALRSDRKYSAVLPCCGDSMLSFDNVTSHGVMQGLQLVVHHNSTGLSLFLDDQNVTDKLIDCRNRTQWVCLFSDVYDIYLYWVVLETPLNVSSITMCNHLPTCHATGGYHLSLQTMAVYGQE